MKVNHLINYYNLPLDINTKIMPKDRTILKNKHVGKLLLREKNSSLARHYYKSLSDSHSSH